MNMTDHSTTEYPTREAAEAAGIAEWAARVNARLADLVRLAEAYRETQREAIAHHRQCQTCLDDQACSEAGSIFDEMTKRRIPFWKALDRALVEIEP